MQTAPLTKDWCVEYILAGSHPMGIGSRNQGLCMFGFCWAPDTIPQTWVLAPTASVPKGTVQLG